MKGRPEGTLQREAGDLFLSLLLCSEKGVLSSYQMKMGVWNRALWASDLNLHMELRPAHLCFPAERAKGVNDKISERHLRAFRNTHPEKALAPHSNVLPGESQERRSLVGCRLWGHTESDMTEAI